VGSASVSATLDLAEAQQQAARIAARADIRDVRLFETTAKLLRPPEPDSRLSYRLNSDATVEYDNGGSFVVRVSYHLAIIEEGSGEGDDPFSDPQAAIAEIEFKQGGLFELEMRENDDPVRTDELEAFAVSMGQFALYPYARQYVYDLTGRLALPPLTLSVLRLPFTREQSP
jgi:hypothetical protein